MAKGKERKIHVAYLQAKHHEDVFTGWTKREVYKKLAAFIADYCWGDYSDSAPPRSNKRIIEEYFSETMAGNEEWVQMHEDTIRLP